MNALYLFLCITPFIHGVTYKEFTLTKDEVTPYHKKDLITSCNKAAAKGDLGFVQYMYYKQKIKCNHKGLTNATKNGHLPIIQWFSTIKLKSATKTLSLSIEHQHYHILEWLKEQPYVKLIRTHADKAAENGLFDILQWLYQNYIYCTQDGANNAAKNNNGKIVYWLTNKERGKNRLECNTFIANKAAIHGNIMLLQHCENYDVPCTHYGANIAAEKRNIEVVSWLMLKERKHRRVWSSSCIYHDY
mgnify:CR=1 FL=1